MNYLHSGVNWPVAIEFVIENVNILELENKLVNEKYMHQTQKGKNISQIGRFDDLSDFRLD